MAVASKESLIARYLYGLNLTDDFGNPYPDELYEAAIATGIATIKTQLDLELEPIEFYAGDVGAADFATRVNLHQTMKDPQGRYGAEKFDYSPNDAFGLMKLRRRPLLSGPTRILVVYPGAADPVMVIPESWIHVVEPLSATVHIIPAANSAPVMMGGGWHPRFSGGFMPGLLRVDYRAGFDELPPDILHAIYLVASFNVLNPAGDLIVGAGIASSSISFAGLSQSVNTTSSATNAGYGSRIIQYQKELKELIPAIRAKYHGPSLHVI